MKKKGLLVVAAVVLLVSSLFGQNTNMYFNGGYQGSNWTYGSETVGTGFYDGSINNVQVGPGQPGGPGMVCDDFNDNIYSGEHWTANGLNIGGLNSSNIGQTLFGASIGLSGYAEVAFLMNQMFTSNPNASLQAAYSEAIWALTGGVNPLSLTGQALTDYNLAKTMGGIGLSQFTNLWLYTPNPRGPGQAQEMWGSVPVPEGGAAMAYLLLAGLCCFGAMFLRSRRQTGTISAA